MHLRNTVFEGVPYYDLILHQRSHNTPQQDLENLSLVDKNRVA
jgi:hypothetical protein